MPRKPSATAPSALRGRINSQGSVGLFEVIWIEWSSPLPRSDQNTSLNGFGT
ncbi:hypothetical protein NLY43_32360 [Mesorhizobium sp. C416B]|uniref:hypothetical protein n=1 Tax=Mesorhizobium sp. C416B TaxID=2956834 RepID=UPI002577F09E|nr:hypothetical protein [Mesorhizobium sp. C416B]WJI63214.1 hypothetical protein NLY43_32360 [Mesorhizobium sp. C416B]